MSSSIILGPDEKIIRDSYAHYHGGHSRCGHHMFGRLILTNKRFLFQWQKTVEHGGFFGFGKKKELQTVGVPINIPIDKVISATVETRTRKKGTLNEPATLFSKEQYQVLIVSMETPFGIENPAFEVENATDWAVAIQRAVGGEAIQY